MSIGGRGKNNEVREHVFVNTSPCETYDIPEGIAAHYERKDEAPRGIGDFQRRSNQARDRGWSERRDERRDSGRRGWDSTPRREDAPSVRVPNVAWDSTPRSERGGDAGWGGARDRRWDAPTPRALRAGSPDGDDARLDMREWEEEQLRLDRDWYSGAEEGMMAGDEEHNPLSQYDDLSTLKQAELETKRVVRRALLIT